MARQTFLTTPNLDLIMHSADDAVKLTSWFNTGLVTQYLARGDNPMSEQSESQYLEKLYQTEADLQLGIWHREDKKLIGTTGLHNIHPRDRKATFGILIGEPDYWSRGYGTETLQAMLNWAFMVRDLRRVTLSVFGNNPRGQKCYEKCGFTEIGRYPKHIYKNGEWQDEVLMMASNPMYT